MLGVSRVANAFNWINGLILTLMIVSSWAGLSVLESLLNSPHAVTMWLWATSRLLNSSATIFWSSSKISPSLCAILSTSEASGNS